MKKVFVLCFFLLTLLKISSNNVLAEVRINEIYPGEGQTEWIELYNDSDVDINLTEYTLEDEVPQQIKIENAKIAARQFVIINSNKNILNKDKDTVVLRKNQKEIETISYKGIFTPEKSYVRCPDENGSNWFILNAITKELPNQTVCLTVTPTASPTETPVPTSAPTSQPTLTIDPTSPPVSYDNIYLSEVMPNPEEGAKEWVEIYNDNSFSAILTNWYIDDGENIGSSPKPFSQTINAKGNIVVEIDGSFFNNDGDTVRLLDFNQVEKNRFVYTKTEKGKTYGRVSFAAGDFCLQNPTKGMGNNACLGTTNSSPTPVAVSVPTSVASPVAPLMDVPPTIAPTSTIIVSTPFIIVDSHLANPTPVSNGVVLSANTGIGEGNEQVAVLGYVKGLSVGAVGISLLNIGYILRKIIFKIKTEI